MNVGSVDQTSDNLNGDTVGPIPREIQELFTRHGERLSSEDDVLKKRLKVPACSHSQENHQRPCKKLLVKP